MDLDRLYAATEIAAEHAGHFGNGKIKKCAVAAGFEFRGQLAAEIGLDLRPAQRPELIGTGRRAIGMSEQAHVGVELLGAVECHEEFIVEPQRQALRGFDFFRQRRRECELFLGEQRRLESR